MLGVYAECVKKFTLVDVLGYAGGYSYWVSLPTSSNFGLDTLTEPTYEC